MIKADKLIFDYTVKNHLTTPHGEIKLQNLLLLFQAMSEQHATDHGIGADFCNAHKVAWILASYHIVIERMPRADEELKVSSWPSNLRKIGVKREYLVECNGEVLVRAAALWICLNTETRKLTSMLNYVPNVEVIEEEALETAFSKLVKVENMEKQKTFPVLYNDLDLNNHVNNSCYPVWAFDALSPDWQINNTLKELEIQFKEESLHNTNISVFTSFQEESVIQYVEKENGHVAAFLRSKWEKK